MPTALPPPCRCPCRSSITSLNRTAVSGTPRLAVFKSSQVIHALMYCCFTSRWGMSAPTITRVEGNDSPCAWLSTSLHREAHLHIGVCRTWVTPYIHHVHFSLSLRSHRPEFNHSYFSHPSAGPKKQPLREVPSGWVSAVRPRRRGAGMNPVNPADGWASAKKV